MPKRVLMLHTEVFLNDIFYEIIDEIDLCLIRWLLYLLDWIILIILRIQNHLLHPLVKLFLETDFHLIFVIGLLEFFKEF